MRFVEVAVAVAVAVAVVFVIGVVIAAEAASWVGVSLRAAVGGRAVRPVAVAEMGLAEERSRLRG